MTTRKNKASSVSLAHKTNDLSTGLSGLFDQETRYYLLALFIICMIFYYRIVSGCAHFWEDLIYLEFPYRIYCRDMLGAFQFPHWNPYSFTGMPLFSSLNIGVLYPCNLLLSFIPSGPQLYWYLLQVVIVLHFFFAGVSMFYYARYKQLSRQASLFAAIGFMLCGFFVTHVVHSMMLNILVWLPLVVLFLEKGVREQKNVFLAISGVILGISTLAGHPQITFYEFLFLSCFSFYLWLILPEKNIVSFLSLSIPFITAIGIAMIALLPALELNNNCSRVSWTFEQASEGSIQFVHLCTFLMPKFFGAWTGPDSQAPQYWLQGPTYGYFTYWDTCFYCGIAVVLLALLQLKNIRKDRFVVFSLIWGTVTFFIALGCHTFFYKLLFDFVPGFSRFRTPTRISFTWCFLLPLLAATTIDQLGDELFRQKIKKPFYVIGAGFIIIGLAVLGGFYKNIWPVVSADKKIADFASLQAIILLLNCALCAIPLIMLFYGKAQLQQTKFLLIGALVVDLCIFGMNHHQTKGGGAHTFYRQNKEISDALKKECKHDLFRVNARQFVLDDTTTIGRQGGLMVLKRNQGMIDKIQILEGFNPLNLYRRIPPARGRGQFAMFLDLLNVKYYVNPSYDGRPGVDPILLNGDRLPRAKMFYHAHIFNTDSQVVSYMKNNRFDYRNTLLLTEKPAIELPQKDPDSITNSATVAFYSANKINLTVATEENGLLWLSEVWYPAWKAYVDGKKTRILCADFSFRAIEIPKGSHKVTVVFQSDYFRMGLVISLLTIVILAGYFGWRIRKKMPL